MVSAWSCFCWTGQWLATIIRWCKVACTTWSADCSQDVRQDPSVTAALDEAAVLMDELDALTI